ncbi:unnamed protein product [Adineta steineri]|uniref:Uncharacterized protein n=1 Tax=Adineta steineri TaxID=433720 RepID=A0A814PF67_9BILA|nr:unnamed protein product [Adineta steineri]
MSKPTIGPQPSIVISLDEYAQLLEHQSTGKRTPAKVEKKKAVTLIPKPTESDNMTENDINKKTTSDITVNNSNVNLSEQKSPSGKKEGDDQFSMDI